MAAISRIAVMEGTLGDVSLAELLQVISIGRQYTVIELRRPDQSAAGTLFVKAGKLIAAASADARGKEAFFRLVPASSAVSFHVFRTDTPGSMPEPIGALGALLLEALQRGAPALPASASPSVETSQTVNVSTPANASSSTSSSANPAVTGAPSKRPAQRQESQSIPVAGNSGQPSKRPAQAKDSQSSMRAASTNATVPQQRAPVAVAVAPIRDASARPTAEMVDTDQLQRQSSERVVGTRPAAVPSAAPAPAPAPQARAPQPPAPAATSQQAPDRRRTPARPVSGEVQIAQKPPFVIAIASPKGGCGKTTLALNLAVTLARQNRRVILVDGDVNGDIASAIDARARAKWGAFDVLAGEAAVDQALLDTVMPDFKIMPATGTNLPDPSLIGSDCGDAWRTVLNAIAAKTDFVLVDTPAGMLGPTHPILRGCSHVLGVLQAELIAYRSFTMFARGLDGLPAGQRPRVLGVVLNMVQTQALASVSVLQQACVHLPREWLLETSVPRSNIFLEASEAGLPLRLLDDERPPPLSFLFETLASELISRLEVAQPVRRPQRLLA